MPDRVHCEGGSVWKCDCSKCRKRQDEYIEQAAERVASVITCIFCTWLCLCLASALGCLLLAAWQTAEARLHFAPPPHVNVSRLTGMEKRLYEEYMQYSRDFVRSRSSRGDRAEDAPRRLRIYARNRVAWAIRHHSDAVYQPTGWEDWTREEVYELVPGVPPSLDRELGPWKKQEDEKKKEGNTEVVVDGASHTFSHTSADTLRQLIDGRAEIVAAWRLPFAAFGYQRGVYRPTDEECASGKLSLAIATRAEILYKEGKDGRRDVELVWHLRPKWAKQVKRAYGGIEQHTFVVAFGACGFASADVLEELAHKMLVAAERS